MPEPSRIRPYSPADREAVRRICLETAWGGRSGEGIFADRELVADFLTAYYTDCEPDAAWVVEDGRTGRVVGYLLGCLRPQRYRRYRWRSAPRLALRLAATFARTLVRLAIWRDETSRRSAGWLMWLVLRSWREIPAAPPRCAHFHFNLAPECRGTSIGRELFERFEERVRQEVRRGRLVGIYGQMALGPNRRKVELFRRLGWELYDRRPFSKFGPGQPRTLATLVKRLRVT